MRLLAACLILLLAGCGDAGPADRAILVAGSSVFNESAPALAASFMRKHPSTSVIWDGGGSTGALIAVKRNAVDVAAVAREVHRDEDSDDLKTWLVAKDGLAVIVHPSSPLKGLTAAQVRDVFTGRVTDWRAVGGPRGPIRVVSRPAGYAVRYSLMSIALGGEDVAEEAEIAQSAADMARIVAGDPLAVGYLAQLEPAEGVRPLDVDGVPMSRMTVLSGRYPLSRSLFLIVQRSAQSAAAEFVEHALGPEGQDILERDGFVRVR